MYYLNMEIFCPKRRRRLLLFLAFLVVVGAALLVFASKSLPINQSKIQKITVVSDVPEYSVTVKDKAKIEQFLQETGFWKKEGVRIYEEGIKTVNFLEIHLTNQTQELDPFSQKGSSEAYQSFGQSFEDGRLKLTIHFYTPLWEMFSKGESQEHLDFYVLRALYLNSSFSLENKENSFTDNLISGFLKNNPGPIFVIKPKGKSLSDLFLNFLVKPVYAGCTGSFSCGLNQTVCTCSSGSGLGYECSGGGLSCGPQLDKGVCSCSTECSGATPLSCSDYRGSYPNCIVSSGSCSNYNCVISYGCSWEGPAPTNTPVPTNTPRPPTNTPGPTNTTAPGQPTNTLVPTATPCPVACVDNGGGLGVCAKQLADCTFTTDDTCCHRECSGSNCVTVYDGSLGTQNTNLCTVSPNSCLGPTATPTLPTCRDKCNGVSKAEASCQASWTDCSTNLCGGGGSNTRYCVSRPAVSFTGGMRDCSQNCYCYDCSQTDCGAGNTCNTSNCSCNLPIATSTTVPTVPPTVPPTAAPTAVPPSVSCCESCVGSDECISPCGNCEDFICGKSTVYCEPTTTPVPPTVTPRPTATTVPPTATSVPPTATSAPPTATRTPTPINTNTPTPTKVSCCGVCSGSSECGNCPNCMWVEGYGNTVCDTDGSTCSAPTNTPAATRTPTPINTNTPMPTAIPTTAPSLTPTPISVGCREACNGNQECGSLKCLNGECHNDACYFCSSGSSYQETATCDCDCEWSGGSATSSSNGLTMTVNWSAVTCCSGQAASYTVSACGQSTTTAGTSATFSNCGQSSSVALTNTNCCPPGTIVVDPPVDCWCDGGSCGSSCTMRTHNPQTGIKCDVSYCGPITITSTPLPSATPTTGTPTATKTPTPTPTGGVACCGTCFFNSECGSTCPTCVDTICDNGTSCLTPTVTTRPTSTSTPTPTPTTAGIGLCQPCTFDGQCASKHCHYCPLCGNICIEGSGSETTDCRETCNCRNDGGPGGCPDFAGVPVPPDRDPPEGAFFPVEDYYWNIPSNHINEDILRTEVGTFDVDYNSLIRFDLGSIPSGSIVNDAILRLFFKDILDNNATIKQTGVDVYRKGDPTQTIRFCAGFGYHYVAGNETNENSYDVTEIVQKWVDDPLSNTGFILEGWARGGKISSSESVWPDYNPTPYPTICDWYYPPCVAKPTIPPYNMCGYFSCYAGANPCGGGPAVKICNITPPPPTPAPPGYYIDNARPVLLVNYIVGSDDWFQTKDLDVSAMGAITSEVPADEYFSIKGANSSGVIVHNDVFDSGLGQASVDPQWVAKSPYNGGVLGFDYLLNRLKVDTTNVSTGNLTQKPAVSRIYYYAGDILIKTNGWSVGPTEKIVIFVDGDVGISQNITVNDQGGFLAIIASGDISFEKNVAAAQGIFSADDYINVKGNGINDPAPKVQFVGKGSFIGWKGFSLNRIVTDPAEDPAEIFEARPDLWINFPPEFAYSSYFREEMLP